MPKKKNIIKKSEPKLYKSFQNEDKVIMDKPLPTINKSIKKSHFSKKFILLAIFVLIIILVILIPLLLIELNILQNPLNFIPKEPQNFVIKDECSLVVGQLIHNIKDEGSCQLSCTTRCNVMKLQYFNSSFIGNADDCNSCDCYCN